MKKSLLLVAFAWVLMSCAAGVNDSVGIANANGAIAGFWLGLWHGIVCPVTFIVSLFDAHVGIYEVHNNGASYNFGYMLGVMLFHGGGHAARGRRRGKRG
jgi:hypothetical protein